MSATIQHKAVNAVAWNGVQQLSGQFVRFVVGVMLARFLTPAEFGLIGMIGLFMGTAQLFVNCGLGEGLVQKQDATHGHECSVFFMNVAFGLVAATALYCAAPWIAGFYSQPQLISLTRVMALDVLINSFGIIQMMLLTKAIDFKTQLIISISSTTVSGVISIAMALSGCGAMSLAAQIVIGDLLRVILLWWFHNWRPSLSFSFGSLRDVFPYGWRMFASGMLNIISVEIYTLVIGKLYTPDLLGLYTRARQTQALPLSNLCGIVGQVAFPVFASVQHDKAALKRGVRKAAKGLSLMAFPMMAGLAVAAHPFVVVLLTKKWEPCVPFLQLLCISGPLYPLHMIHLSALAAQGKADLFLRLEIIKKSLVAVAVAVTFRYGVKGLLIGDIAVAFLSYYLNCYYSCRLFDYSWSEQILDLLPYAGASALMGVAMWFAGWLPSGGDFGQLTLEVVTGAAVYLLCCWSWNLSAFADMREILASRILRRNRGPREADSPFPAATAPVPDVIKQSD